MSARKPQKLQAGKARAWGVCVLEHTCEGGRCLAAPGLQQDREVGVVPAPLSGERGRGFFGGSKELHGQWGVAGG